MRILSMAYKRSRSGGEVRVELDDSTCFIVDAELAVQFRLATGGDLAEATREDLLLQNERLLARRRLIRYLSLRRKSEAEARRYLRELKFNDDATNSAIEAATRQGYLDDNEFAQAYVRTQGRTNRKGPRAVRQELLARGVAKETTESALQPIATPEVQREAAEQLARKKLPALRRETDPRKVRQKLHMLLLRKGYDPDIAAEVTRQLAGEIED